MNSKSSQVPALDGSRPKKHDKLSGAAAKGKPAPKPSVQGKQKYAGSLEIKNGFGNKPASRVATKPQMAKRPLPRYPVPWSHNGSKVPPHRVRHLLEGHAVPVLGKVSAVGGSAAVDWGVTGHVLRRLTPPTLAMLVASDVLPMPTSPEGNWHREVDSGVWKWTGSDTVHSSAGMALGTIDAAPIISAANAAITAYNEPADPSRMSGEHWTPGTNEDFGHMTRGQRSLADEKSREEGFKTNSGIDRMRAVRRSYESMMNDSVHHRGEGYFGQDQRVPDFRPQQGHPESEDDYFRSYLGHGESMNPHSSLFEQLAESAIDVGSGFAMDALDHVAPGATGILRALHHSFGKAARNTERRAEQRMLGSASPSHVIGGTNVTQTAIVGTSMRATDRIFSKRGISDERGGAGCEIKFQQMIGTLELRVGGAPNNGIIFAGTGTDPARVQSNQTVPCNPMDLGGRLAVEASVWQRYRYTHLEFECVTQASTFQPGNYCVAISSETGEKINPNNGISFENVMQIGGNSQTTRSISTPFWSNARVVATDEGTEDELYWVNPEDTDGANNSAGEIALEREASQFTLVAAKLSTAAVTVVQPIAVLIVRGTIQLYFNGVTVDKVTTALTLRYNPSLYDFYATFYRMLSTADGIAQLRKDWKIELPVDPITKEERVLLGRLIDLGVVPDTPYNVERARVDDNARTVEFTLTDIEDVPPALVQSVGKHPRSTPSTVMRR